jgi:hypothetical protein
MDGGRHLVVRNIVTALDIRQSLAYLLVKGFSELFNSHRCLRALVTALHALSRNGKIEATLMLP